MLKLQPIERDKAREAIESALATVVEKDSYNANAFAMRGVNLAWLDKKKEAAEALEQATKYSPQQESPIWDLLKKGWEILDNQDKIKEIDTKLAEFRQQQLKKMIEEAQAKAEAQQQGSVTPVTPPVSSGSAPPDAGGPPAGSEAAGGDSAPPAEAPPGGN
jgi:hypothetical protein